MNDNETKQEGVAATTTNNAENYTQALEELRANTVDKKEYDRVLGENQHLINALMKGEKPEQSAPTKAADIGQLRKDLFGGETELSNLDYMTKVVELRKAVMAKGEPDPFLPVGEKVDLTADMLKDANDVATLLEHCIEFAQGDSGLFDAELARHTSAPVVPVARRR